MMRNRSYWTDNLTWACNVGIFVFGIVLAILGALLPTLFETLHLDPAQAGSLFLFLNLGALAATLTSGPLFDRFGFKGILTLSSTFVGLSLFGMARANQHAGVAIASFVLGIGGGGLNAGTNALIADLYAESRAVALNRLGIFFGMGTCFIPFLVGLLLERLSLYGVLALTAGLAILPGLLFIAFPFPSAKHTSGFPMEEAFKLARNPFVLLLGALLFFQSGNEITTSGWMTTFLVDQVSLSPARASFYLASFWAAVVVGRLIASWILKRWKEATLVQTGSLLAALFTLLFVVLPHPVYSVALAFLMGLSMAAIFPSVLAQASARFPEFSGTIIGTLISIALVGGMFISWLAGVLVARLGTGAALVLPVFGFLAVFLLQTFVRSKYR